MKRETLTVGQILPRYELIDRTEITSQLQYPDINKIENLPWKHDKICHSLHHICSRICSFPPSLVRYFILNYSKKGDVVFDPFSGKGTLPLEALLNKRIGWGNDVAPDAYILTKAKICGINPKRFFQYIDKLSTQMGFVKSIRDVDKKVKIFYHNTTLKQIFELKILLNEKKGKYATFTKAIILGILHGPSKNSLSLSCSHSYSMAPNYVKNYAKKHNLNKPNRVVINCIKNKATDCFKDELPKLNGKAFNSDSRKLKIKPNSCNLIVTSPPYFAVQRYGYDNWLRLWFLGYEYKNVEKSLVSTNSEIKYVQFMYESLCEMNRVLKNGSNCFVIVGDVKRKTVKGGIINTAELLIEPAIKAGFNVESLIVDNIPQGRKVFNSSLSSKGIHIERILHLKK